VDGGVVRCEQESSGARDVYLLQAPAVVSVLEGLNLPRYPSVPGRLRAQKKPVAPSAPTLPPAALELHRLVVPAGQGKQATILGHGPDAAPAVVEVLAELGVL
jgi:electron transfer flavoprotein beta subunit